MNGYSEQSRVRRDPQRVQRRVVDVRPVAGGSRSPVSPCRSLPESRCRRPAATVPGRVACVTVPNTAGDDRLVEVAQATWPDSQRFHWRIRLVLCVAAPWVRAPAAPCTASRWDQSRACSFGSHASRPCGPVVSHVPSSERLLASLAALSGGTGKGTTWGVAGHVTTADLRDPRLSPISYAPFTRMLVADQAPPGRRAGFKRCDPFSQRLNLGADFLDVVCVTPSVANCRPLTKFPRLPADTITPSARSDGQPVLDGLAGIPEAVGQLALSTAARSPGLHLLDLFAQRVGHLHGFRLGPTCDGHAPSVPTSAN